MDRVIYFSEGWFPIYNRWMCAVMHRCWLGTILPPPLRTLQNYLQNVIHRKYQLEKGELKENWRKRGDRGNRGWKHFLLVHKFLQNRHFCLLDRLCNVSYEVDVEKITLACLKSKGNTINIVWLHKARKRVEFSIFSHSWIPR